MCGAVRMTLVYCCIIAASLSNENAFTINLTAVLRKRERGRDRERERERDRERERERERERRGDTPGQWRATPARDQDKFPVV